MGEHLKTDSVFKHQQHLKIQKEEETWISSEDLRTEGSSDEEAAASNYKGKKIKNRKKSINEKKETVPLKETEPGKPSTDLSANIRWRPKRGSLTLPNLDDPDLTDIHSMYSNMEVLERRVAESLDLLESERDERLKMEEEFCKELSDGNKNNPVDRDTNEFFKLCNFDVKTDSNVPSGVVENLNLDSAFAEDCVQNIKVGVDKLPDRQQEMKFIRKNIQLAAKAMSKLPLTDEEKQKLDQLLHNSEEDEDYLNGSDGANQQQTSQNAFSVPEHDIKRINEIDAELQNYTEEESSDLRNDGENKTEQQENFWRNLVLEQALKEIDSKLAKLMEAEKRGQTRPEDSLVEGSIKQ